MYLSRISAPRLQSLVRQFPAVAVLGPRQCGKTTLVRRLFPHAEMFDLERPSDVTRLEADPEYTLRTLKGPVILDEAQRMPALFPILRALIDERRKTRSRFILLGSAHPSLVRGISESLAGRIGFLDLFPLSYAEVAQTRVTLADLWLRGGFPEPCLHPARRSRRDWMDGYIRTFLERDLRSAATAFCSATHETIEGAAESETGATHTHIFQQTKIANLMPRASGLSSTIMDAAPDAY